MTSLGAVMALALAAAPTMTAVLPTVGDAVEPEIRSETVDHTVQLRSAALLRVEAESLDERVRLVAHVATAPDPEQIRSALADASRAVGLWRELGDARREGRSLADLATLHSMLSEHRQALARAEEAAALCESSGDDVCLAHALGAAGTAHLSLGAPDAAEPVLHRAADLASQAGLAGERHTALHNLGMVAAEHRRYQEALELHRQALATAQTAGLEDKAIGSRIALATIHFQVGDLAVAERWLREAIAGTERLGERAREGWAWRELGRVLAADGRFDDAVTAYERSLAIRRELGNRRSAAVVLGDLATLERSRGRLDRALELYRQALGEARALGDAIGIAVTLGNLGLVELELGRPVTAREALEEAMAVAPEGHAHRSRSSWLATLARASLALDDPARAVTEIEPAIELDEEVRADLADPELRARYLGQRHKLFSILVEAHLRRAELEPQRQEHHLGAAFAASERSRSRSLLELVSVEGDGPAARRDARFDRRGAALLAELRAVQLQLLDGRLGAGATAELERQRLDLEDARRRLDETRRIATRVSSPLPLSAAEVRSLLPPGSVLLEYLVSEYGSFLVVVDHARVSAHRLAPEATLRELVATLRSHLTKPGRRDRQRLELAATELGRALLGPALPRLAGATQLVIAADGPLHLVPFDVLRVAPGDGGRVIDRWTVASTPSASVLAALGERAATRSRRRQLVAVAAPTLAAPGAVGLDPESTVRGIVGEGGLDNLPSLTFAAEEGRAVATAFDGPFALLTGSEASEAAVKGLPALTTASHLHFATHALISNTLPQHSSLVLASGDDGAEDGLLQAFEIADLELTAELAVLSACATGTGDEVGGEGVLGLTQAVVEAGASAVVISLWQVNDRSTRLLMERFYSHLAELGPADALRRAKLELAADPRFEHPFHWAPFVLSGRMSPPSTPTR